MAAVAACIRADPKPICLGGQGRFDLDENPTREMSLGLIYLFGAIVLGGIFLFLSYRLIRSADNRNARTLYLYSLLYLALVFGFMILDSSWG